METIIAAFVYFTFINIMGGIMFGLDNNTFEYIKEDMKWNEERRIWYNVVKQIVITPFKIFVYVAHYLKSKLIFIFIKLINKD